ncbi:MAG: STAS domain-containing protein [Hyphomicrobiales bacterium]|jgi:ABC-type transporter Mla MlaB component|nr:STAS domain-containing protein [Hyphomicrobiales bacterium]
MSELAITWTPEGPLTLATVKRSLDSFSSSSRKQPLILDLSRAGPFDSSVLALIATMKRRAGRQGVAFTIKNVPDSIRSLAEIYDLQEFIASSTQ